MRVRVLPYRVGSQSARNLSDALDARVLKLEGSTFRPKPEDVVINWGQANRPENLAGKRIINAPELIRNASNKLSFFETLGAKDPEAIPAYWTRMTDVPDGVYPVVCRTELAGHSGQGIVIAHDRSELVNAPLYTKYIKKKDEYRVHIGNPNFVISLQRKARNTDVPDDEVNWEIRNHSNGFIFQRSGVTPPASVVDVALRVLAATKLDFGAVDVVYNQHHDRSYALELNTAPGLEGTTIEEYAAYFALLEGV